MRYRSLELVLGELQWFLDRQVPQGKFLDRTFNSNRERTLAIWQYIADHDNGVTNFHFEVTADRMGEEEIALLRRMRPGLVQLEIGVQSTNPETLEAINRRTDIWCHKLFLIRLRGVLFLRKLSPRSSKFP